MQGFRCDFCGKWFEGKPTREWQLTPKDTSRIDKAVFYLAVYKPVTAPDKDLCLDCMVRTAIALLKEIEGA